MGKPKLLRIPDTPGGCNHTGPCDHVARYAVTGFSYMYCACHIPIAVVRVKPKMLKKAIEFAALESDLFQIDTGGNIRLEGED